MYVVRLEMWLPETKGPEVTYRTFPDLAGARRHKRLATQIFKPYCKKFDVGIYEWIDDKEVQE